MEQKYQQEDAVDEQKVRSYHCNFSLKRTAEGPSYRRSSSPHRNSPRRKDKKVEEHQPRLLGFTHLGTVYSQLLPVKTFIEHDLSSPAKKTEQMRRSSPSRIKKKDKIKEEELVEEELQKVSLIVMAPGTPRWMMSASPHRINRSNSRSPSSFLRSSCSQFQKAFSPQRFQASPFLPSIISSNRLLDISSSSSLSQATNYLKQEGEVIRYSARECAVIESTLSLSKEWRCESLAVRTREFMRRIGVKCPRVKLFCFIGTSELLMKKCLTNLGGSWVENPHSQSEYFHLRWLGGNPDIGGCARTLQTAGQLQNRFENSEELTNRARLLANINQFVARRREFARYFLPQFDLAFESHKRAFIDEYHKFTDLRTFMERLSDLRLLLTKEEIEEALREGGGGSHLLQLVREEITLQETVKRCCRERSLYTLIAAHPGVVEEKTMRVFKVIEGGEEEEGNYRCSEEGRRLLCVEAMCGLIKMQAQLFEIYPFTNFDNLWVVKSCVDTTSEGKICSDEGEIIGMGRQIQGRIVQKYIERACGVGAAVEEDNLQRRRFDVRQWVLVRSFSPLLAYRYSHGFLRFGKSDERRSSRCKEEWISGWEVLRQVIAEKMGGGVSCSSIRSSDKKIVERFEKQVEKRICELIRATLLAVQSKVKQHTSCFQVFCFDITIDEEFNPYLIDVTTSSSSKTVQTDVLISAVKILFQENEGGVHWGRGDGQIWMPVIAEQMQQNTQEKRGKVKDSFKFKQQQLKEQVINRGRQEGESSSCEGGGGGGESDEYKEETLLHEQLKDTAQKNNKFENE